MKRVVFSICCFFLFSALSWGQIWERSSWELTPTMKVRMSNDRSTMIIWSTATSEAMPNFTRENPGPWKSIRSNFVLKIEGNITSIGNYAFAGCEYLTGISFVEKKHIESSNYLTSIGEGAFEGCVRLVRGLTGLPNSLRSIGNYAFRGCTSAKYFYLPSSLTSIGDGAFQGCTSLEEVSVKWTSPLSIQSNVFADVNTANVSLSVPYGAKPLFEAANVWKDFGSIHAQSQSSVANVSFFRIFIEARTLAWCILILSVVLFFMRITKNKNEPRQGSTYIVSNTLFLTVCAIESIYFLIYLNNAHEGNWFCDPNSVGWFWTIVNFFLLGGVVINQILYLFDVMNDVFANGNAGCDLRLGYFSWIGAFVCALLCTWFYEEGLTWVGFILVIIQIIQAVLIFRSYGKNIKGAFWGVFVYLLGICGTVSVLFIFIGILILVMIVIAAMWLALKSTGGSTGSSSNTTSGELCSSCMYYPGGYGRNCSHRTTGDSRQVNDNTTACSYWRRG